MQVAELNVSLLLPVVHEGVRGSVRFWRYRSLSSEDVKLGQGFHWSLADLTQAWYVSLRLDHPLPRLRGGKTHRLDSKISVARYQY